MAVQKAVSVGLSAAWRLYLSLPLSIRRNLYKEVGPGASLEVDFMKRVSVLLPPISRGVTERGTDGGPASFSIFSRQVRIFLAPSSLSLPLPLSPLSPPITIAMSPKTRGVFSSPHFILLRWTDSTAAARRRGKQPEERR